MDAFRNVSHSTGEWKAELSVDAWPCRDPVQSGPVQFSRCDMNEAVN